MAKPPKLKSRSGKKSAWRDSFRIEYCTAAAALAHLAALCPACLIPPACVPRCLIALCFVRCWFAFVVFVSFCFPGVLAFPCGLSPACLLSLSLLAYLI